MGEGVTLDVTLRDASMQNLMQVYLREGVPPLSTCPVVKDLGTPSLRVGRFPSYLPGGQRPFLVSLGKSWGHGSYLTLPGPGGGGERSSEGSQTAPHATVTPLTPAGTVAISVQGHIWAEFIYVAKLTVR